jgi:AcrR family transcriptional regulator
VIAKAFAELGYRRATTAQLARRCGVRENILYRLWPDKKAMFIAAIDYVYQMSAAIWQKLIEEGDGSASTAERLLRYEAEHYGESGLQRIIFAGLSETDDPQIRKALRLMYDRFQRFIRRQIAAHRDGRTGCAAPDAALCAWAVVGLGNVSNIGRELGLLTEKGRKRLIGDLGRLLLEGRKA